MEIVTLYNEDAEKGFIDLNWKVQLFIRKDLIIHSNTYLCIEIIIFFSNIISDCYQHEAVPFCVTLSLRSRHNLHPLSQYGAVNIIWLGIASHIMGNEKVATYEQLIEVTRTERGVYGHRRERDVHPFCGLLKLGFLLCVCVCLSILLRNRFSTEWV